MDHFAGLRKIALEKRNKAIGAARAEYRLAVEQIEQLRVVLGCEYQRPSRTNEPILAMIRELIPRDQLFTVLEIVSVLKDREPDRSFNVPVIRTYFPRLEEQGVIRRISKNASGQVLWAAAGVEVEATPFGAMAATDVAEAVLRELGPMRLTELVVEMRRRGFRSHVAPKRIAASLRTCAKQRPGRFTVGKDGRWDACPSV